MTKSRAAIIAQLAAAGRPQMWANETEAAALSGMSASTFKMNLRDLEARGFPKRNALNGKRSIPAIEAFFLTPPAEPQLSAAEEAYEERALENWDGIDGNGNPRNDPPRRKHILR